MAQPGAYDPEGSTPKTENDLAISTLLWRLDIFGPLCAQRGSTSVKNGQSQSADLLIALVRLLARQAAG